MDKFAYMQFVKARVNRQIKSLRLRISEDKGVKNLVAQYLSCSEMDGAPRWVFDPALLQRAYEACTSDDESYAPMGPPDYLKALEVTPKVLETAFKAPHK